MARASSPAYALAAFRAATCRFALARASNAMRPCSDRYARESSKTLHHADCQCRAPYPAPKSARPPPAYGVGRARFSADFRERISISAPFCSLARHTSFSLALSRSVALCICVCLSLILLHATTTLTATTTNAILQRKALCMHVCGDEGRYAMYVYVLCYSPRARPHAHRLCSTRTCGRSPGRCTCRSSLIPTSALRWSALSPTLSWCKGFQFRCTCLEHTTADGRLSTTWVWEGP